MSNSSRSSAPPSFNFATKVRDLSELRAHGALSDNEFVYLKRRAIRREVRQQRQVEATQYASERARKERARKERRFAKLGALLASHQQHTEHVAAEGASLSLTSSPTLAEPKHEEAESERGENRIRSSGGVGSITATARTQHSSRWSSKRSAHRSTTSATWSSSQQNALRESVDVAEITAFLRSDASLLHDSLRRDLTERRQILLRDQEMEGLIQRLDSLEKRHRDFELKLQSEEQAGEALQVQVLALAMSCCKRSNAL